MLLLNLFLLLQFLTDILNCVGKCTITWYNVIYVVSEHLSYSLKDRILNSRVDLWHFIFKKANSFFIVFVADVSVRYNCLFTLFEFNVQLRNNFFKIIVLQWLRFFRVRSLFWSLAEVLTMLNRRIFKELLRLNLFCVLTLRSGRFFTDGIFISYYFS